MFNKILKISLSILFCIVYLFIAIFLFAYERPTYSDMEKRKLLSLPTFTIDGFFHGKFTEDLSNWFSDTVPRREDVLFVSSIIKSYKGLNREDKIVFLDNKNKDISIIEDENIKEKNIENVLENKVSDDSINNSFMLSTNSEVLSDDRNIVNNENEMTGIEDDNVIKNNIIITGKKNEVRGLECQRKFLEGDDYIADVINAYKELLPGIDMYLMIIPKPICYYCPEKYLKYAGDQEYTISRINAKLRDDIKKVDCYNVLKNHKDENIYLRTDHHWSALGAYYATEEFAKVANVDFMHLTEYIPYQVENFVGSMYTFTGDREIAKNGENFVYFCPQNVNYKVFQAQFLTDEKGLAIGHTDFIEASLYRDVSAKKYNAYLTFLGGDSRCTYIETEVKNGRHLLIFKDSYGNAIPQYLLKSFEKITVVDYRYFTDNILAYIVNTKVTDILFANNIQVLQSKEAPKNYYNFLIGLNIK